MSADELEKFNNIRNIERDGMSNLGMYFYIKLMRKRMCMQLMAKIIKVNKYLFCLICVLFIAGCESQKEKLKKVIRVKSPMNFQSIMRNPTLKTFDLSMLKMACGRMEV